MKNFILKTFCCALIIVVASCNNSATEQKNTPENNTVSKKEIYTKTFFTADINGSSFVAEGEVMFAKFQDGWVMAVENEKFVINIKFSDKINAGPNIANIGIGTKDEIPKSYRSNPATINIEKLDDNGGYGTFSFEADGGTDGVLRITNGKFSASILKI